MLNISYAYVKVEENITKEKALHKECLQPVEKLEIQLDWISSIFNFRIKLKYFSKNEER